MTKSTEIEAGKSSRAGVVIVTGPELLAATDIYALVNSRSVREVTLTHDESDSMIREYQDLCQLMPPLERCVVRRGDHTDASSAAVAIISGPATFLDQAESLVAAEAAKLEAAGFAGVIIVTGVSADALASAVMNVIKLQASRIIGLGPQSPGSEHANGGWEGTSVWCTASSGSVNTIDTCTPDCPYFEKMLESSFKVFENLESDDSMLTQKMAVCVTQICDAVLNDSHATLAVYATVSKGEEISFTLSPCLIGHTGIIRVLAKDPGFNRMEEIITSSNSITRSRDRKMPGVRPASLFGTS